jgi:hypothetical protein
LRAKKTNGPGGNPTRAVNPFQRNAAIPAEGAG